MTITVNAGPEGQMHHFNGPDVEYRQPVKRQSELEPEPEHSPPIRISPRIADGFATAALSGITAEIQQAARAITQDSFAEVNRLARELNPVMEIQQAMQSVKPDSFVTEINRLAKELNPTSEIQKMLDDTVQQAVAMPDMGLDLPRLDQIIPIDLAELRKATDSLYFLDELSCLQDVFHEFR